MDIYEAILARHSVRQYIDKKLPTEVIYALQAECEGINEESGLHIQLATDEEKAFKGFLPKYGKFSGVQNYVALVGPKGPDFDEMTGYYGERIVLKAQMLGLNTCWVALTVNKMKVKCEIAEKEKLGCIIALGYGANQGVQHKMRKIEDLCEVKMHMPKWFEQGMNAVLLAPSAVNQQHYKFILKANDTVEAISTGGAYSKVDLGIAEYHFEIGAGNYPFKWADKPSD